ncbi:hypothetical protein [Flagellimonas zhangzhouensis]|uniref:Uncharacterized protein n=1 Tax=Flagellimonas zhangzhouensis TaxID=1073328 RepID=A0A1H2SL31_9FLAO|nr:hypothetical protein [Allomuricauda zhangzhouensis]SDQ76185.1 hypothetical protein SAMN05216294_2506 [Allomuricauda zhangzhouensis]SDW32300.1 hypothetical protein SAMN04487892_1149 [Allomuricauda zhangzhouensis]
MSPLTFFYSIILSFPFLLGNTSENQSKEPESFPTHWYEISTIDGEDVIFIPCDYQNTEFIFEDTDKKNKLIEVTGQDGWESTVDGIITIDDTTTKVNIRRPDNVKITFTVTKISPYLSNWSWKEPNYDGGMTQYSTKMTSEAFKDKFKVVEEPPCM